MTKKIKVVLILFLLLFIFTSLIYYFNNSDSGNLVLYGNIDQRQVELAFIDSERVAEVLVQEGEEVKEGQILARLETRRLEDKIAVLGAELKASEAALARLRNGSRPEEIEQARAALASAVADLAYANQQFKRYQTIWDLTKGGVSKQDVDLARKNVDLAKAKLNYEEKSLELAELGPRWEDIAEAEAIFMTREKSYAELKRKLSDSELKSPSNSVVRRRLLEPGDMALPQRAVFSLAVLSPKWVRAYLAEPDLGNIRHADSALIYTDSHPDEGIKGRVGFISSVAEFTPKTVQTKELRTSLVYEIRIYVDDPQDRLRLGMPATIVFPDKSNSKTK